MLVPAEQADIARVVELVNRAYRGTGGRSGWTVETKHLRGDRITEQLLAADMRAKPHAHLLRWEDEPSGRLLGCVWLEPLGQDIWYLGSLAVAPDRQNSGLGRSVLTAAEQWVRDRSGVRVRMTVINVRDDLIAWYLRRGYAPTGETDPFPYGDDRYGTPLREDLSFVVLEKELLAG